MSSSCPACDTAPAVLVQSRMPALRRGFDMVAASPGMQDAASQNVTCDWSYGTSSGLILPPFSRSHKPGNARQASECCQRLCGPTKGLFKKAAAGGGVSSWHRESPHCLLEVFSGSFSSRTNHQQPCAQLIFILTSLLCLQPAAASQDHWLPGILHHRARGGD